MGMFCDTQCFSYDKLYVLYIMPNKYEKILYDNSHQGGLFQELYSIVSMQQGRWFFFLPKPRSSLRPVSTQENKHRIGLDFFPSCIIHTAGPKKLKILQLYHRMIGSNWNRKLVPKAHPRVLFRSDPFRSHAYFPGVNRP